MGKYIEVERTLVIGDARMQENDEAYVEFQINTRKFWTYAELVKLSNLMTTFLTKSGITIDLVPAQILRITDKAPEGLKEII